MELTEAVAEVLGITAEQVDDSAKPGDLENWDSRRHLQVIVRLEEVYQVSFSYSELKQLTSIGAIRRVLRDKGIQN